MEFKIFGRNISATILTLLVIAGIGSGALLTYYGTITATVEVNQGLTVDGRTWNEPITEPLKSTTSLENPVLVSTHTLNNGANVDAEININPSCSGAGSCDDITTKYYETNLKSGTLALSKKNADWSIITGDTDVVVTYSTDVATGETKVMSISDLPSGYTLVYYADVEFADDGTRLVTPGQAYELATNSVIPISSSDGNLKDAADYCAYDGYAHCRGIKLWAIRTADLSGNTINWGTGWQSAYYFETDLLGWNHVTGELTNPVDVSANSGLDFVIVTGFPVGTYPGTYTITTNIAPA